MTTLHITGGAALKAALKKIAEKVADSRSVSVGFMENAKYPDGTPVAMVAAIHNFGAPGAGIPPRPFFSDMVKEKSPDWGPQLGHYLKASDLDSRKAFNFMGELIQSELRDSILYGPWQPLSQTTLMLRTMRSQGASVTGKTVGQASALVASGAQHDRTETGSKALVDTGTMLRSISYEVTG